MVKESISLLTKLTEAHAVPGFEDEVRAVFLEELEGVGDCKTDQLGSVSCDLGGKGPKLLISGHMDEVGFRVQAITKSGFIKMVNVGGWWGHVLLAQAVIVKTQKGKKIEGIISSKPPHFLPDNEKKNVLALSQMFVDIGANSEAEAKKMGIKLGDPIAPKSEFRELSSKGKFVAKAFDNRIGMAGAIQAGKTATKKRKNQLFVAGTVMEEVGLRGAKTLANQINPDVAIVLECAPADDTPGFDLDTSQAVLGGGVQIRLHDPTAIMSPKLVSWIEGLCVKNKIKYQLAVRTSGGTDAGSFHLANEGIPTIVLSVPARYIHSHNSIMQMSDYSELIKLIKEIVATFDQKVFNQLIDY